jgi:hypothetical protein
VSEELETRPSGRPPKVLDETERGRLTALGAMGLSLTMSAARLGLAHRTLTAIFQRDPDALIRWGLGRAEAGERLLRILWAQAEEGSSHAASTLARLLDFPLDGDGDPTAGPRPSVQVNFAIVTADGTARPLRTVTPTPEDLDP